MLANLPKAYPLKLEKQFSGILKANVKTLFDMNSIELAKLSPSDMSKVKNIPITANVSGSFGKPSISTDLKQASANLANQLVQMEKVKLLNKGKDMLGGLLGNNIVPADTTKAKEETKFDPVKSVIKGILKKKNNN